MNTSVGNIHVLDFLCKKMQDDGQDKHSILVNSLGENCQDCEDLACLTLKTCDNFMNHGTSL